MCLSSMDISRLNGKWGMFVKVFLIFRQSWGPRDWQRPSMAPRGNA